MGVFDQDLTKNSNYACEKTRQKISTIAQNESREISALQENLIIEKLKRDLKQNYALKNQIQAKPEKQFSKTERLKSCQEIILQENILVEKNKMEQDHVEVGLPTKKYINAQRAKQISLRLKYMYRREFEYLTNLTLAMKKDGNEERTENCEH